jgi:hypothetical protein
MCEELIEHLIFVEINLDVMNKNYKYAFRRGPGCNDILAEHSLSYRPADSNWRWLEQQTTEK